MKSTSLTFSGRAKRNAHGKTMSETNNVKSEKESSFASSGDSRRAEPRPGFTPLGFMQGVLPEDIFLGILSLERRRAERSNKKFLLLLIDAEDATVAGLRTKIMSGVIKAASAARRDTDLAGWYKVNSIFGIIYTELGALEDSATIKKLVDRIHETLLTYLSDEEVKLVHVSAHIFTDGSNESGSNDNEPNTPANHRLYPDLFHRDEAKKGSLLAKRAMDIIGSAAALLLFSPLLIPIAIAVKLTSKGPILFKQERLGQFGRVFTCLKFRSMYANNNLKIHQEFMKGVISGAYDGKGDGKTKPVYKMTDDPRITRIGRILRRTSLDELPQFINVLKGDMSIVGPRPPLAYEYEEYDLWHRGRVLEVKPGITGLWQVKGRSRVNFDDMVRLDLHYARRWSLWLDFQILAKTPRAVLRGDGAY